jgi:hypothetical protein
VDLSRGRPHAVPGLRDALAESTDDAGDAYSFPGKGVAIVEIERIDDVDEKQCSGRFWKMRASRHRLYSERTGLAVPRARRGHRVPCLVDINRMVDEWSTRSHDVSGIGGQATMS